MPTFAVAVLTATPPGAQAPGFQVSDSTPGLLKVGDRESLLRAVDLLTNHPDIAHSFVAFLPDDAAEAKRKHGANLSFSGFKAVEGADWFQQAAAVLAALAAEVTHVVLHDAARPAVGGDEAQALLAEAAKVEAVALAGVPDGPLVTVDEAGMPTGLAPAVRVLATPMAFSREAFEAYVEQKDGFDLRRFSLQQTGRYNVRVTDGPSAKFAKNMLQLVPGKKKSAAFSPFDEAQW